MISGIWGSAFCILFKRLLEDNRNLDPAEMIRQEMGLHDDMGQQLEEEQNNDSSDISDDSDDDVQDSTGESEEEKAGVSKGARSGRRKSSASFLPPRLRQRNCQRRQRPRPRATTAAAAATLSLRSRSCSSGARTPPRGSTTWTRPEPRPPWRLGARPAPGRRPAVAGRRWTRCRARTAARKGVRFCHEVKQFEQRHDKRRQQPQQQHQQQQQARKDRPKPALKKANTVRRGKSRSYWSSLLKGIFEK